MTTKNNLAPKALLLSLCVLLSVLASGSSEQELNQVDNNGMRQGYWIIKGYMSDEDSFGPNDTVEEGEYLDNLKEGTWKRFHSNGNLRSEITYSKNRPYGAYAIYYENSQLEESSTWHRNKNVGDFKRYYSNGQPQQAFFFADNGKRNGQQKYFYENGQLALDVVIQNGKEEGEYKRYYENGDLKESRKFTGGVTVDGTIKSHQQTRKTTPKADPIKKPNVESQSTPDKPNVAYSFEPDGHNVLYDANQQITQVGNFNNGRLWDGKWYRYSTEGILVRIEIYKGGKYIGTGVIEDPTE